MLSLPVLAPQFFHQWFVTALTYPENFRTPAPFRLDSETARQSAMPAIPVTALIFALLTAVTQTPEERLAKLEPAAQAAAAELSRFGYKLQQAGTSPNSRGVVELKRPDSPYTIVVIFARDRVKLHLNVMISEAVYGRSETLKAQLAKSFPGLEQSYLGSSDGRNLANLSLSSAVATPPKAWYGETLATLMRAAEPLTDKPQAAPVYSDKEQKLLAKLQSNPFQKSVVEQVKRAGWRIDDAYGFTRGKEPPGVYLAVSRSEAPVPNAAMAPLSLKIHHNAVDMDAIGFVPAREEATRVRFQAQLQKSLPAFKVAVISSSFTPGYDRIVLSLPKALPAADAPGKLLSTLQRLKEAMAGIE